MKGVTKRRAPRKPAQGLSPRTLDVARCYAGGFLIKQIAADYRRSESIINRELDRFAFHSGARSRRDVVLACRRLGLEPM